MITAVDIQNFKRLRGTRHFEFPEGIIGISGPNGEGKSTLVNALGWAFYGPASLRTSKSDVATWGERQCTVSVDLEIDERKYICSRWQNAAGTTGGASLVAEDGTVVAEGLAPVTKEMERLTGVDYDGYQIGVFARQDELNGLAELQPAKRMQTVLRLLGIADATVATESLRKNANMDKRSLEALRSNVPDLAALEVSLDDALGLRAEAEEILRANQQIADEIKVRIDSTKQEREALEPRRSARAEYLNRLAAAKQGVLFAQNAYNMEQRLSRRPVPEVPVEPEAPATVAFEDYAALQQRVDDLTEKRGIAEGIRAEINKAKQDLAGLSDAVCPTCGRPYDNAQEIHKVKESLEYRVSERQAAFNEINEIGKRLKADYDQAYVTAQAQQRIASEFEKTQAQYRNDVRTYQLMMAQRDEAQSKVSAAEEALHSAQQAVIDLEKTPVADVEEEFRSLLKEEESLRSQENTNLLEYGRFQTQRDNAASEIERLTKEIERHRQRAKEMGVLEKSVVAQFTAAEEMNKMRERLISRVIPSLADSASALVSDMTAGKYSELNLTGDYEIQFRNDQGDLKGFDNLSGGEQRVFALALRLAIAEMKPNRLGVLILDEVLESLDSETGRAEAVWTAIENLSSRYPQTFVITHVEAYKDRAPTTIHFG